MCGISGGMSTVLSHNEIDRIKQLMVLSTFRGMLGSGAIVVHPHNKKLRIETVKSEFCAAELTLDPKFIKATSHQPKIIVSHARAPTMGGLDEAFIHPHRVGHITGVHNGTMVTVMKENIDNKKSDSLMIFEAIAQHGVGEFIRNSRGAYSLVWVDSRDGTLNFLRNGQRPMVFARQGGPNHCHTMFWSSEKGMLEYVLSGRGNVSENSIVYVAPKEYQHVQFPLVLQSGLAAKKVTQFEDPFPSGTGWNGALYAWQEQFENYDGTEYGGNTATSRVERAIPLPDQSRAVVPIWERGSNRWGGNNGTGRTSTNSTTQSPSETLADRVRIAQENRAKVAATARDVRFLPRVETIMADNMRRAAGGAQDNLSGPFRGADVRTPEAATLIQAGPCVVCDETPLYEDHKAPKIHPVRFGKDFVYRYICADCVQHGNPIALSVLGATVGH